MDTRYRLVAARLCENEAVQLDISGPKPWLTISPLASFDEPLEQETGLNPTEMMTDTAGTSDLVFGLFLLLGYQFSTRLDDAGASVFWRIYNDADYGVLNDIARGLSDPRKIVLQWDEMIRAADPLKLGKVQASVLLRS
ncbi:TnpA family transposase [Erwinia aphidicola]|nr:TnpA family transposase [Erwinia aphidicola]